jgi:hypothetical protein
LCSSAFQRDVVEPTRVAVEGAVDARQFVLDQNIAGAFFRQRQALIIGLLEGLEGPHHFSMRHHRVERNARLGFQACSRKVGMGIDIH